MDAVAQFYAYDGDEDNDNDDGSENSSSSFEEAVNDDLLGNDNDE